jgi:hypothetical protein
MFLLTVAVCMSAGAGVAEARNGVPDHVNRYVLVGKYAVIVITDDHCSISYVLKSDHPGLPCEYKPYLAELDFQAVNIEHLFFTPRNGDPATTRWRIARRSSCPGQYAVWRETSEGFQLYGHFRLVVPK